MAEGYAMKAAMGSARIGEDQRPISKSELIGQRLGELEGTIGELEKLSAHVCGSYSQAAEAGGKLAAAPNGLFEEWDARLSSILDRARDVAGRMSGATGV